MKYKWFKVEFLINGGTTERYRTVRVPINGSNESLREYLYRRIKGMGFSHFELLQWYETGRNYLN
jgi:hypothetical protein